VLFRNSRKAKRVWFCPWYALDLITLYTALSDRDRTLEQLLYAIEHDNRAGFWTDIAKINAFRIQLLDEPEFIAIRKQIGWRCRDQ
jgi:hypothetical protein